MADWKKRLATLFEVKPERSSGAAIGPFSKFCEKVVRPAFDDLCAEFEKYEMACQIEESRGLIEMTVFDSDGEEEFYYAIKLKPLKAGGYAYPTIPKEEHESGEYRAEVVLQNGPLDLDVRRLSKVQLIEQFLYEYRRHTRWQS